MTTEELRAMTAQGPTVVLVQREALLGLIDDRDAAEALARTEHNKVKALSILAVGAVSLWLWQIVFYVLKHIGVL